MSKEKGQKTRQTIMDMKVHGRLKIEEHEPHYYT